MASKKRAQKLTPSEVEDLVSDWIDRLRQKLSGATVNCQAPSSLVSGGGFISLLDDIRKTIANALDLFLDETSGMNWSGPHGKVVARYIDPVLQVLVDFGGDWCDGNEIGEKTLSIGARLWRATGGAADSSGGNLALQLLDDDGSPYAVLSDATRLKLSGFILSELNTPDVFEKNCLHDTLAAIFDDFQKVTNQKLRYSLWERTLKLDDGALAEALLNGWLQNKDREHAQPGADSIMPALTLFGPALASLHPFLKEEQLDRLLDRWPVLRHVDRFSVHWDRNTLKTQAGMMGALAPKKLF